MPLPPLSTLRAFEAAARLGSMSAAARELALSQPAISRTLAHLEGHLGQPLFRRSHRGLQLTDAGRALQRAVDTAFSTLAEACDGIRAPDKDRTVWLTANSGFAQQWLAGRLPALRSALPRLYLRLTTSDRDSELDAGEYDLVVRFGTGQWRNCTSTKLLPERVIPVCAPAYLARHRRLARADSPAALAGEHLLHLDEASSRWLTWASWFTAQGIARRLDRPALTYASYPLLLQAALAGEGVALGWLALVERQVADGSLVPLFSPLQRDSHGYFLCRPRGRRMSQAKGFLVDAVADWIVAQCRG
jgi:DNA-binding transcriptional LysR family regulator